MDSQYRIEDMSQIMTPAVVVFLEKVQANLEHMVEIARDLSKLRPHCKTHKTRQIIEMQLRRGIHKHKCATFAEAEMLANCGVEDIVLAYNLVGPNIGRAVTFRRKFPEVSLSVTADHPGPVAELGAAMVEAGTTIEVLLDLDTGLHRTGIEPNADAAGLYQDIAGTKGLVAGGLHVYDGHQHQRSRQEREAAIKCQWQKVIDVRDMLTDSGLAVPRMVCGGSGSFPVYAQMEEPTIEVCPGTIVFNDAGYTGNFPDMMFPPAALLLTRVISRPTADLITLDLGIKAVACDPPVERRCIFPDLPDAELVLHNEEHLVIKTERAAEYQPGDELMVIPWHICPSTALHKQVFVVSAGKLVDCWDVIARDRSLSV